MLSLYLFSDRLILWHECLHDGPADEVCHSAVAEYYHVASRLACHTEKLEGFPLLFGIGEEFARTEVDGEAAQSTKCGANACDGGYGAFGNMSPMVE